MKGLKRTLALVCVLCLCAGFGGCRKKEQQPDPATNTDSIETLGTIVEYTGESSAQSEEGQQQTSVSGGTASQGGGSPQPAGKANGQEQGAAVTTAKPTETATQAKQYTCTLTIQCKALLSNMDKLPEGKRKLVPANGVLYSKSLTIKEGETAYDVLKRSGLRVDASYTPAYGSVYIKGIGNIYEKDCGGSSGWMFAVNGSMPGYGCSKYKCKNGDRIEFFYTC